MTTCTCSPDESTVQIDELWLFFQECKNGNVSNRVRIDPDLGRSLWNCDYGLAAAVRLFQLKHGSEFVNVARNLSSNPVSLSEWILTAQWTEFSILKSRTKNYPRWGTDLYNYLFTCWCVAKCESQLTINIRKNAPAGVDKTRALLEHAKAIERLASSLGEPLLWVFDEEYPPNGNRENNDKAHIHAYSSRKVLREAQGIEALRPFNPRYTIHSAICNVSRPTLLDGIVSWPPSTSGVSRLGYDNTLDYAAAKVVGLAAKTSDQGVAILRRSSRYARVRRRFANYKGGQYRHWGHVGFTPN